MLNSFGAIEGRIQTFPGRSSLRFTLFDALDVRAVSCSLREGREEVLDGAWDRRVIVEGWVSRDPDTGRPVTIQDIERVTLVAETAPGAFRAARGVVKVTGDALLPEDAIRRLRDA